MTVSPDIIQQWLDELEDVEVNTGSLDKAEAEFVAGVAVEFSENPWISDETEDRLRQIYEGVV